MQFKDFLATFPEIEQLSGLDIIDETGTIIHHIPAIEGKLGSLKLYNALAEHFSNQLNKVSAEKGLEWFAEHVDDAKQHPQKHPNIDLLFDVIAKDVQYQLKPILK